MFKVAKYADEVNETYILAALKAGYSGYSYTDRFSPKLVKQLLHDYRATVKNLAWFFDDAEGRTCNYLTMDVDPTSALENLNDSSFFIRASRKLETLGIMYTPEEFIAQRVLYKGQIRKLHDILSEPIGVVPLGTQNIGDIEDGSIKYSGKTAVRPHLLTNAGDVVIRVNSAGFVKEITDSSLYTVELEDDVRRNYSSSNIQRELDKINAEPVTISMDLYDMITCSMGDCRSCLSQDNIHAAGAIQNFRTDFATISFIAKKDDRSYKTGRSWLFLRATERGFKRDYPFFKSQKRYGKLSPTHLNLIKVFTKEKLATLFPDISFESRNIWSSIACSTNVHTGVTGHSHTSAPGYIDTPSNNEYGFFVDMDKDYSVIGTMLLPFKDMLDLDGNPSNITSFHKKENRNNYLGATDDTSYIVTCKATNTEALDCDCVEVDGEWYRKDVLSQLLQGSTTITLEEDADNQPEEENYDDIEIDEDF